MSEPGNKCLLRMVQSVRILNKVSCKSQNSTAKSDKFAESREKTIFPPKFDAKSRINPNDSFFSMFLNIGLYIKRMKKIRIRTF